MVLESISDGLGATDLERLREIFNRLALGVESSSRHLFIVLEAIFLVLGCVSRAPLSDFEDPRVGGCSACSTGGSILKKPLRAGFLPPFPGSTKTPMFVAG